MCQIIIYAVIEDKVYFWHLYEKPFTKQFMKLHKRKVQVQNRVIGFGNQLFTFSLFSNLYKFKNVRVKKNTHCIKTKPIGESRTNL